MPGAYHKWMEDVSRSRFDPYDATRYSLNELNELMGDLEHPGQEGDRRLATQAWEARRSGAAAPRDALGRTAAEVYTLRDQLGPVAVQQEYIAAQNAIAKREAASRGITLATSTDAPTPGTGQYVGTYNPNADLSLSNAGPGISAPTVEAHIEAILQDSLARQQASISEQIVRRGGDAIVAVPPPSVVTVQPIQADLQTRESSPVASILGSLATGAAGLIGGLLTDKAKQMMEARRDQPAAPVAPPGMMTAGFTPPWGQIGRVIGGVASTAGAAATGYQIAKGVGLIGGTKGGLGAVEPQFKEVKTARCPKGYARAIDGYCYPKGMLPRNLRMWKPDPRPVVSRTDQKAIRRAAGAKKRLVKITKDAGAFASLNRPSRAAKKGGRK